MVDQMILKVCGMRDPENIRQLRDVGVNWMGIIFYDQSTRFVDKPINLDWTKGMKRVGVFVNANNQQLASAIRVYSLDIVQLHGTEDPSTCEFVKDLGVLVIKAFNLDLEFDFSSTEPYEASIDYFLFDAKGPLLGGNGTTFDWGVLERYAGTTPFILSGGIDLQHAETLRKYNHPKCAGIDINSRFELSPALKDIKKIKQFKHELFG